MTEYYIPLKNNKKETVNHVRVDKDTYDNLNKFKWCLSKGYACSTINGKNVYMHRYLFNSIPKNYVIDHINNNKLDNRKENIRIATRSQNSQNMHKKQNASSKYYGVTYHDKKYIPSINNVYLGRYKNEDEAAKIYDIYSYLTYGKDAHTNNIISYEDAIKYTIEDLKPIKYIKPELPLNIFKDEKNNGKYYIAISHNKSKYKKRGFISIKEAEEYLTSLKKRLKK
jgi:hypothetical protein